MLDTVENISSDVQRYQQNGVVLPKRILSEEEIAPIQKEFSSMEGAFGGKLPYTVNLHSNLRWAYDLTLHPKILDYITPFLGDEIGVIGSMILAKYPKTDSYVSWHQDGVNSNWDPEHSISIWLALSESNAQNGCMQVIPKTHLNSKQEHVFYTDENNMHYKSHGIALEVDESKALNLELQPGEISIHHNNIIHGSKPNTSDTKRIGLVIRYIKPKYVDPDKSIIYARGKTRYNHINAIQRPNAFLAKSNRAAYREFLKQTVVPK
jgi:non-heme Fe2+,alpha-ketoglutarate-dependent halogenase